MKVLKFDKQMPLFCHHPHRRFHFPPFFAAATNHHRAAMCSSSSPQESDENLTQVLKYHNQTKHSFINFARGPHGLDWANQPNPFRRYISAPLLPLLHPPPSQYSPLYHSLFSSLPTPQPLSESTISQFFYHSLALSAWKSTAFSTWSLRVNPSSGNLHPTESYIISPPVDSFANSSFVAHYAPKEHALEVRTQIPADLFPNFFPQGSFLVGFSSIFWREAWKYGERAFRYSNHDVGHAIGAVSMAAAGLGWDVKILDGLGFRDLEKLLGLENHQDIPIPSRPVKGKFPELEFEHPDCVLLVFPNGIGNFDVNYKDLSLAISQFSNLEWNGKPNSLSKEHVCWDIIYRTAEAVQKPLTDQNKFSVDPFQTSILFNEDSYKGLTLSEVVRKRRSAVDMDGITSIERETFYQIMSHCLPSGSCKQKKPLAFPYRALSWDSEVHFALFVHRVVGLPKGLYFLVRNEEQFEDLKTSTRSEFSWVKPEGCPDGLPLYELTQIDCRELSKRLSCTQDIASDGCFSLGMVSRVGPTLKEKGVWMYPRLFWETGLLGQVLYLEAHAVGISATGIGCFFDDPVHEVLGLRGSNYQSLYHFTVGAPVLDKRIMSLPAYPGPTADAIVAVESAVHGRSQARAYMESQCQLTRYPKLCIQSLSGHVSKTLKTQQQLAQVALMVSLYKAKYARAYVIRVREQLTKRRDIQAVKDCLKEINDSVDQITESIKELSWMGRDGEVQFMWHESNVQSWVSAALTDATTCIDGFSGHGIGGKTKATIKAKMLNVAQVTSNALALFNRFTARHRARAGKKP